MKVKHFNIYGDTIEEKQSVSKTRNLESFNHLSQVEWAKRSRNVIALEFEARNEFKKFHGATFPPKLAEYFIEIYTKPYDIVLDPFLGTGSTFEGCINSNRSCLGFELNFDFFDKIQKELEDVIIKAKRNMIFTRDVRNNVKMVSIEEQKDNDNKINMVYFNEDCTKMDKVLEHEIVDFTFTSPPYADFIQQSLKDRIEKSKLKDELNSSIRKYSDHPDDLGNCLNYKEFLKMLKKVLESNYIVTKSGGYSAWVVKDYRDKDDRTYIDLHSDLAHLGQEVGFKYHDLIVLDQNKNRKLLSLGYPTIFYANMNSNFIVIFRK